MIQGAAEEKKTGTDTTATKLTSVVAPTLGEAPFANRNETTWSRFWLAAVYSAVHTFRFGI